MKRWSGILISIVFLLVIGGVVTYWQDLTGLWRVVRPVSDDIVTLIEDASDQESDTSGVSSTGTVNDTEFPLTLPLGFRLSVFAQDLEKPRVLAMGPQGNLWVSEMNAGAVTVLEERDGQVTPRRVIRDLHKPHGLAFDPDDPYILYIAEERALSKVRVYSDSPLEHLMDLPEGKRHTSRTLAFGPDNRLYMSIGSSCDVCHEQDTLYAAIHSLQRDGSDFQLFARGLRNTVFFDWNPVDGKMWGTEMGRDNLGDDLPPDEVNIIEEGQNYGWPICYGDNIHDTDFDKNIYARNPCMDPLERPSHVDLQAHVAPLGLAFIPEEGWPAEYARDLLIAYHGSWNRSEPVGYKIVRLDLDDEGNVLGEYDFISGWLTDTGGVLGRPVDVRALPGGILYISDDKAGVVSRAVYQGE